MDNKAKSDASFAKYKLKFEAECDTKRLNKAAPAMLKALEDMLAQAYGLPKSCGHEFFCACPGNSARAAVALAKGEV